MAAGARGGGHCARHAGGSRGARVECAGRAGKRARRPVDRPGWPAGRLRRGGPACARHRAARERHAQAGVAIPAGRQARAAQRCGGQDRRQRALCHRCQAAWAAVRGGGDVPGVRRQAQGLRCEGGAGHAWRAPCGAVRWRGRRRARRGGRRRPLLAGAPSRGEARTGVGQRAACHARFRRHPPADHRGARRRSGRFHLPVDGRWPEGVRQRERGDGRRGRIQRAVSRACGDGAGQLHGAGDPGSRAAVGADAGRHAGAAGRGTRGGHAPGSGAHRHSADRRRLRAPARIGLHRPGRDDRGPDRRPAGAGDLDPRRRHPS